MKKKDDPLIEDKDSIIMIIRWYQEGSKINSPAYKYYEELIENIKNCNTLEQLENYEKIVDDWL